VKTGLATYKMSDEAVDFDDIRGFSAGKSSWQLNNSPERMLIIESSTNRSSLFS
jgi:hypothetical protein